MENNNRCGFGRAWCDNCGTVRRHHVAEHEDGYLWQCWVDGDEHFTDTNVPRRPPPRLYRPMGLWMWFRPRSVPVRSVEERRLYLRKGYRYIGIATGLAIAPLTIAAFNPPSVAVAGVGGAAVAVGMAIACIYLLAIACISYRRIRQPYGEAVIRDELRWHGWDRKAAKVLSKSLANEQGAETVVPAAIHGVQSSRCDLGRNNLGGIA